MFSFLTKSGLSQERGDHKETNVRENKMKKCPWGCKHIGTNNKRNFVLDKGDKKTYLKAKHFKNQEASSTSRC
jgi:hypothetical protein